MNFFVFLPDENSQAMIAAIFKAISIGFLISMTPGIAFFSILQTSISRGFRAGFLLAVGIACSDIFIVSLCYLGLAGFMKYELANLLMSIIGGVILIVYGVVTFLKKKTELKPHKIKQESPSRPLKYIGKGFLFNFTNPFVWFLWIGVVASSGSTVQEQLAYFISIILVIFTMDTLKSFFAHKIKKVMTPNLIYMINRGVGLVLGILGLALIIRMVITLYYQ